MGCCVSTAIDDAVETEEGTVNEQLESMNSSIRDVPGHRERNNPTFGTPEAQERIAQNVRSSLDSSMVSMAAGSACALQSNIGSGSGASASKPTTSLVTMMPAFAPLTATDVPPPVRHVLLSPHRKRSQPRKSNVRVNGEVSGDDFSERTSSSTAMNSASGNPLGDSVLSTSVALANASLNTSMRLVEQAHDPLLEAMLSGWPSTTHAVPGPPSQAQPTEVAPTKVRFTDDPDLGDEPSCTPQHRDAEAGRPILRKRLVSTTAAKRSQHIDPKPADADPSDQSASSVESSFADSASTLGGSESGNHASRKATMAAEPRTIVKVVDGKFVRVKLGDDDTAKRLDAAMQAMGAPLAAARAHTTKKTASRQASISKSR
jgi:hypothetical protein